MGEQDSVVIARFNSREAAELAAQRLEAEGIEPLVMLDDGGGAIPSLDLARGVGIRVAVEDAERARAVLEELPEE